MTDIDEIVQVWSKFCDSIGDWRALTQGVDPKQTVCGPVYEPTSPLPQRPESFAIGDMRSIKLAQPHYHKDGETEIYFVVHGSGVTVVGGEETRIKKGSVVITPPNTAHFTIPKTGLVLVIINTPSFNSKNVVELSETDSSVKFDKAQLERLLDEEQN